MSYDARLADHLHETFEKTEEFMSAYVDYCDAFVGSNTYDRAFEAWVSDDPFAPDPDQEHDDFDDGLEYYGLHAEDAIDYGDIDFLNPYGDDQ